MADKSNGTPYRPEQLTSSWLTSRLRDSGVLPDAEVSAFKVEELGPGKGQAARVVRLRLEYTGGIPGPGTIIAKFPSMSPPTLKLAGLFRLYEREVGFYLDVGPRVGLRVPRLYYASYEEESGDFVLLIADMFPAKEGDLAAGCTLEAAESLIQELAAMHARWWGSADLGHLDWLPRPNYVSGLEYEDPTARDPWAKFLDRTKSSLPQSLLALCKKLRHDRSVLDRLSTPPLTLVHGDLRLNNVMYSSAGNNATRTFIDWQTAVRGRGPMDIASLFTSSLQPDDRRIAEVELLPAYHASLLQLGVTDYSLEDCWQDYRLAVANQFSQVVFLSSVLDVEDRLEEGVGEATGLRLASALIDLDLERLLPGRRRWRGWVPRLPGLMARLWP